MSRLHLFDVKYWKYSLFAMPIMIPLALWASWDVVTAPQSTALKVAVGVGLALLTYILGVLLFWWNALAQNHWRKTKRKN
ncbi:hypothetical protein [Arcanobacterium phocae]|uniref:hypothetical protein n=1 Tax=Arcanobacterium phocae TaxID=131112 RepID=UPI001C0F39B1|nr:hypothetical protein [Arcanobacterium phocae]